MNKLKLRNSGFGLFSIMERMIDMGREMEIETAPNFGTKITLIFST